MIQTRNSRPDHHIEAATKRFAGAEASLAEQHPDLVRLIGNIEGAQQILRRAVQDTIQMATADFWDRRAEAFEFAMPRATDYRGAATDADLAARAIRCRNSADQCRAHARVLRGEFDE